MAGHDPRRGADEAVAESQLDDGLMEAAVLAAGGVAAESDAQLLRRRGADQRRVAPGEPRHRLGQLLQPPVVGPAAVVQRRVGLKDQLVAVALRRRGAEVLLPALAQRDLL